MNEPTHSFVFRVWPYLALALAVAGFAVRLLLIGDRLPAVRHALPRARRVFLGPWMWRACWALLVAAHLAGLLFPRAIVAWTRAPWRLLAVEAIGFCLGLAVLAALIRAVRQHVRLQPRGGWSLLADFGDAVFLSLLFIGVASGLLAASLHRWGSAWGAATVAPYAASLLHGRPAPAFVEHLPLLVRLHLFTAFAAFAVFPATRLALLPLALAHRALALAGRVFAAAARPATAWLRRKSAAWLWPDAEYRWLTKALPESTARKPRDLTGSGSWTGRGRGGGAAIKHRGETV